MNGIPQPPLAARIRVFEGALSQARFDRLLRAVRATGRERMRRNYQTTFWFPRDAAPRNVAEEAIGELIRFVEPGPECGGIEWWLGRLRPGKKLNFHFDRDMTLRKLTGEYVHPLRASILYLNDFPGSPTVITDQVPAENEKGRFPIRAGEKASIEPAANRYVVFPGNLRHGVRPAVETPEPAGPVGPGDYRLSLLVNYWERRPMPPICFDYDGTIYAALRDEAYDGGRRAGSA